MILLDTDVTSHLLRSPAPSPLTAKLQAIARHSRHITTISVGEILFGIERTGRHEELRTRFEGRFIPRVTVLPFDLEAARAYSLIKTHLWKTGQPIDEADMRIAAIAISRDLTLISGNESHFRRIPGLKVENWLG